MKKTFHVETKEINVVVHGTKFNLTAHPDSPTIDVSLIEGSVSVEDSNHIELARLTPQLTMKVIKQDLQFDIIHENTSLTSLWSQSKCMVQEASAEEVFQRMSYWYGLKIQVKNDNMKQRYSFTINNESFREIIELINELTPLEYSINGEEVIIRYK